VRLAVHDASRLERFKDAPTARGLCRLLGSSLPFAMAVAISVTIFRSPPDKPWLGSFICLLTRSTLAGGLGPLSTEDDARIGLSWLGGGRPPAGGAPPLAVVVPGT
jgi:hypothetical protein